MHATVAALRNFKTAIYIFVDVWDAFTAFCRISGAEKAVAVNLLRGVVTEAHWKPSGQRAIWSITDDYECSGGEGKCKSLKIRSVYAGEPPATILPVTTPLGPQKADSAAADVGGDGDHRQARTHAYSVPAVPISTPASPQIGLVPVHDTTWAEGDDQKEFQAS